jgi:hypothetical protein
MNRVRRIEVAEERVGELQQALTVAQDTLEVVESVARVADAVESSARRLVKVGIGLAVVSGIAIVVIIVRRKRGGDRNGQNADVELEPGA